MRKPEWVRKFLWPNCWTCDDKGYTLKRGERILRAELKRTHPSAWADEMVNGGFTYRAVQVPCKKNCEASRDRSE